MSGTWFLTNIWTAIWRFKAFYQLRAEKCKMSGLTQLIKILYVDLSKTGNHFLTNKILLLIQIMSDLLFLPAWPTEETIVVSTSQESVAGPATITNVFSEAKLTASLLLETALPARGVTVLSSIGVTAGVYKSVLTNFIEGYKTIAGS